MKVVRRSISFLLIIIIIGGTGYLTWNFIGRPRDIVGMNMPDSTSGNKNTTNNTQNNNTSMSTIPGTENNNTLTAQAIQSKDKLSQVVTMISDAVNQITIDPYSKVTVQGNSNTNTNMAQQQGSTTINIYPNSNNTVNSPQPGGTPATGAPSTGTTGTTGSMPVNNMVYNQSKLEQLHNGIFKLAQGMMLLNELNDDLALQSSLPQSSNYDSLVMRYKVLEQDKYKLNKSLNLINEASILINVNPYTAGNSYVYDIQQMDQLHKGIYKLAQGMLIGSKLGEDFTNQMVSINSTISSNAVNNMGDVNTGSVLKIGSINFTVIVSIVLIIFIIIFLIALYRAIKSILRNVTSNK